MRFYKKNYINDVMENISIQSKMLSKVFLNTAFEINKLYENIRIGEYTAKVFENLASSISNMYYTETIKDCVNILINSKIKITDLVIDEEINSDLEVRTDFINNARFVTAQNLNVRQGPGKEFEVVASLKYGDGVKVLDTTKYWTKVEYNDVENNVNIIGWGYTRYITGFEPELLEIDASEEK